MRSENLLIPRRSFIGAAAPCLGWGLRSLILAQTPIERGEYGEKDLGWTRTQLLELVNSEREAARVARLAIDDLACDVAQAHAVDMASGKFLSHWGRDGRKPYQRYALAGGVDAIQENVSAAESIGSLTPKGVAGDLTDMHVRMIEEVPPNDGHRRAILGSQQTHVGFGVALNGRSLRLTELYVARYIRFDSVPKMAKRQATVVLTGQLLNSKHYLYEVDVFHEPLPNPAAADWQKPRPYSLPADYVALRPKTPEGLTYPDRTRGEFECDRHGKFRAPAKLTKDAPGIYTVLFWVKRMINEKAFPAGSICIEVE